MIDHDEITDILVVDDDDLTAELLERSLRKERGRFRIVSAHDGLEGLVQLRGSQPGSAQPPMIVVLDLNMPRMSGLEFLRVVRADATMRQNVIFVLTTSDADEDRCRVYEECVAGYIRKSDVGRGFRDVAHLISTYCKTVYLPA
ncbi:response regulator [Novosphingobium aquimarinum]|uniref:response regulator n=1 Tax=Novosphingobium aquimarinum TaxID=2682494 RepID=UPI0012EB9F8C|nr:response regulator [Novosphingobium aquimarinum]